MKSRTLNEEPNLAKPYTESEEPSLTILRTLNLLPRWQKSTTDKDEAKRRAPYIEVEDPNLATDLNEKLEPKIT
jgi:hypothetical protein